MPVSEHQYDRAVSGAQFDNLRVGFDFDEMREQRRVERNTIAAAALVKLDPAVELCINRLIVSEWRDAGANSPILGCLRHSRQPLRARSDPLVLGL